MTDHYTIKEVLAGQVAKSPYSLGADSITESSGTTGSGYYNIKNNSLYQPGVLGTLSGVSAYQTGVPAPTTKAPRVCDELDSLASLSAVDYLLTRRPDGVNIGLRHGNKHPFELTCAEVHLEAAFRSALQLYLLPYFDLKK